VLTGGFFDPINDISTDSEQHCSRYQAGQQGEYKAVVERFAGRRTSEHPTETKLEPSSCLIERFFNQIKLCRPVLARYDKLAANYLAFFQVHRLWLRVNESMSESELRGV
jgi:transposase